MAKGPNELVEVFVQPLQPGMDRLVPPRGPSQHDDHVIARHAVDRLKVHPGCVAWKKQLRTRPADSAGGREREAIATRNHLRLDAVRAETRCNLATSAPDAIHSLLPGLRVKLIWQERRSLSIRSLTALVLHKRCHRPNKQEAAKQREAVSGYKTSPG